MIIAKLLSLMLNSRGWSENSLTVSSSILEEIATLMSASALGRSIVVTRVVSKSDAVSVNLPSAMSNKTSSRIGRVLLGAITRLTI